MEDPFSKCTLEFSMNQFNHKLNVRPLVAMPSDFLISNPKSRAMTFCMTLSWLKLNSYYNK